MINKILTFVLLAISVALFYVLYRSIQGSIEETERIKNTETAVIERLKLIREAEIVFMEVNGRYTANWDSLINFINNGQVPILERKEEIIQKAYGGEEVKVHIDTLGFISARDRIFKKNYTMNVADNGIFQGYNVKVGDRVIKNQKAYKLKVGDRETQPPFAEQGIITNIADVPVGAEVKRGMLLINFWDYVFNPNVDIARIAEVPEGGGAKFDIFVGKVDKAGLMVQVIEVKDPKPANPERKESNEAKNRKPLRFGSRTDVSTSGNWE